MGAFAGAGLTACTLFTDLGGFADPEPAPSGDAGEAGPSRQSYPATPVLDDFERPDGPAGASWIRDTGTSGTWVVESRVLRFRQGATNDCGNGFMIWGPSTFGADQEVHVRLVATPNYGTLALRARINAAHDDWVEVSYAHADDAAVVRQGSKAAGDPIPLVLVAGDQLGARFLADGRVQVFVNGKVVAERATQPASQLGAIGIMAGCAVNGAGTAIDDFGGGDLP